MVMALGSEFTARTAVLVTMFLFLAVWVPCCTSDIVFPLLFAGRRRPAGFRRPRQADRAGAASDARPLWPA
jgi:hypothetical protein